MGGAKKRMRFLKQTDRKPTRNAHDFVKRITSVHIEKKNHTVFSEKLVGGITLPDSRMAVGGRGDRAFSTPSPAKSEESVGGRVEKALPLRSAPVLLMVGRPSRNIMMTKMTHVCRLPVA